VSNTLSCVVERDVKCGDGGVADRTFGIIGAYCSHANTSFSPFGAGADRTLSIRGGSKIWSMEEKVEQQGGTWKSQLCRGVSVKVMQRCSIFCPKYEVDK
jgi:hypothetical protein